MAGSRAVGGRWSGGAGGVAIRHIAFVVAALASALPARADWSDEFDGGFSAPWIFAATDDVGDPPSTGVTTAAVVEAGAADVFGYVDAPFGDLAITADSNASPAAGQQSLLGVLARGDPAVGSAYLAGLDFESGQFAIARSDDFIDFQTPLVASPVPILRSTTYHIQFFLIGSRLTARLLDATTRTLLSTITVLDTSFASGAAGLIVETAYDAGLDPVGPVVGTFDSARVVPEPGASAADRQRGHAARGAGANASTRFAEVTSWCARVMLWRWRAS